MKDLRLKRLQQCAIQNVIARTSDALLATVKCGGKNLDKWTT